MTETRAQAFVRRVRATPVDWTHEALVEHLLSVDPIAIGLLASRALVLTGVLVPTELARFRVAERVAWAVLRDVSIPDDVDGWLEAVARHAADSLRFDGLARLAAPARAAFCAKLARCLGVDEARGADALAVVHGREPEAVAALRSLLPANWTELALEGVELRGDASLAVGVVRAVVTALHPHA